MIAIADYDAGNLDSVVKAISTFDVETKVTSDRKEILSADALILPGVGAFGACMNKIRLKGLEETIRDFVATGKPFLGICLGMQMIFESSEETPGVKGLGLLPGTIRKLPVSKEYKVPHMGWNSLDLKKKDGIFKDISDGDYVYFVHSYYLDTDEKYVAATTDYSVSFDSAVEYENIHACQFHPEKSGSVGLKILGSFVELSKKAR